MEAAPRGDGEEQQGEGERPVIQISSSNAGNRGMKCDFCLIDEKQMLSISDNLLLSMSLPHSFLSLSLPSPPLPPPSLLPFLPPSLLFSPFLQLSHEGSLRPSLGHPSQREQLEELYADEERRHKATTQRTDSHTRDMKVCLKISSCLGSAVIRYVHLIVVYGACKNFSFWSCQFCAR